MHLHTNNKDKTSQPTDPPVKHSNEKKEMMTQRYKLISLKQLGQNSR